jgi:hypothetical protein
MSAAVEKLADARNKLNQNVAFDEDGEAYFTAKKVEEQEDGMLIEKSEDSEVEEHGGHKRHYLKTRDIN